MPCSLTDLARITRRKFMLLYAASNLRSKAVQVLGSRSARDGENSLKPYRAWKKRANGTRNSRGKGNVDGAISRANVAPHRVLRKHNEPT
jgi:hypothetical protein